jgi:transcriptional regulator with XRE-family HTH domain
MTVQALASKCADLGLPLGRPAISKLENGLRQTITVDEVLVLARALGVAPLLLLFPIGAEESIEVLPGEVMRPFRAALWFTGEQPWPDDSDAEAKAWWEGSFPAIAFRDHVRLADGYRHALRMAQLFRQTAYEGSAADRDKNLQAAYTHEREVASIERQLRGIRKAMRDRNLEPPVTRGLEHIDCADGGEARPLHDGYVLGLLPSEMRQLADRDADDG